MSTVKGGLIISTAFIVTGNMLGAGILALPVKTGLSGLIPSLVGITLMWLLMLTTALILAGQDSLTKSASADLPTFFEHELGKLGKWIAVPANLIILYGLLVAYISGAGDVLESLFAKKVNEQMLSVVFYLVASTLALFGLGLLRRGNALIMICMWLTFGTIVYLSASRIDTARMHFTDWHFLPTALPVVVTAFHFHNIIPTLCRSMNFDQRAIRISFFIGTGIGYVMNVIWVVAVIGALPLTGGSESLLAAYHQNLPATVPLARLIPTPLFLTFALAFALLAMTAAYMTNGTALTNFLRDLCASHPATRNRFLPPILAFVPPLIIALLFPHLFLKAIGLVGGVGIGLIFGVLPGLLVVKRSRGLKRIGGVVLILAFALAMFYEIGMDTHALNIQPHAEYWEHPNP